MKAWNFDRWTHRVRWWCGYYLRPWRSSAFVCELRGHKVVRSVDIAEGFDTLWCERCGELLRG